MAESLRMTTAPADLARLYPWLDEAATAAGIAEPLLGRMHVALEEAVMNVAMHAYPPGEVGDVTVWLAPGAEAVALVVEDHGQEFDSAAAELGGAPRLDETGAGGLGLRLLRHYCPDMSYQRQGNLNRLTLHFTLRV